MTGERLEVADTLGHARRTILNQRGEVVSIELHFSDAYKASVAYAELVEHMKRGERISIRCDGVEP